MKAQGLQLVLEKNVYTEERKLIISELYAMFFLLN